MKNLGEYCWSLFQDLKLIPHECEAGMLTTRLQCSYICYFTNYCNTNSSVDISLSSVLSKVEGDNLSAI